MFRFKSVIGFNLYTQNQVGDDFILCVGDCQFFAGFYLWSKIRLNILTDLSPQGARKTLGRNLLAGIWAESWPELGPNAQPRVWPENDPNNSGRTLSATIWPDFRDEYLSRHWAECLARRSARIPAERIGPNHSGHFWAEVQAGNGPKNSA